MNKIFKFSPFFKCMKVLASDNISWVLYTEVVAKIFPNLNVFVHLVVPVGWGSCLLRLAIFVIVCDLGGFFLFIIF